MSRPSPRRSRAGPPIRRRSTAPSAPRGTRRAGAGTGSTTRIAARCGRWCARRWREHPPADGSVHQGAAGSLRRHRARRRRPCGSIDGARTRRDAVGRARFARHRTRRTVRAGRRVDALEQCPQHPDPGRPLPVGAAAIRCDPQLRPPRLPDADARAGRREDADLHANRRPGEYGDGAARLARGGCITPR